MCQSCPAGAACDGNSDCSTNVCDGGVCQALASCSDGVRNGGEGDVDCGGSCAAKCTVGKTCAKGSDCASSSCAAGVCAAPSCSDGILNGAEVRALGRGCAAVRVRELSAGVQKTDLNVVLVVRRVDA